MNASAYVRVLPALVLLLTQMSGRACGRIIHVDSRANGLRDGSSWVDAFNCPGSALAGADANDEIRIAAGLYRTAEPADERDLRAATFYLKNSVVIRGGYAGSTGPDPNARNVDAFRTTLSGDLNADDTTDFNNHRENSYHVITLSDGDVKVVLDGLTITGGNAVGPGSQGHGGGLFNASHRYSHDLKLIDCTFAGNLAQGLGGAVYHGSGSLNADRCYFLDNRAASGAGLANCEGAGAVLDCCVFTSNYAYVDGGAVINGNSSTLKAETCTFSHNSAGGAAGAIADPCRKAAAADCLFAQNWSMTGAGIDPGRATDCRFSRNVSLAEDYPELTPGEPETTVAADDGGAGPARAALPGPVREKICQITLNQWCSEIYEAPTTYQSRFGPISRMSVPSADYLHLYVYRCWTVMQTPMLNLMLHDTRTGAVTAEPVVARAFSPSRGDGQDPGNFDDIDQDGRPEIVVRNDFHCGTECGSTVYRYFHIAEDLSLVLVAARETRVPCLDCPSRGNRGLIVREFKKLEPNRLLLVVRSQDRSGGEQGEEVGWVLFECDGPGARFEVRNRWAANETHRGYVDRLMTHADRVWDWCKAFR